MNGAATEAPHDRKLIAHVLPILLFVLLLGLGSALKKPGAAFWRAAPEFWIYPLQTILCAGLLIHYRREYDLHPIRRPVFTIVVAMLAFALWIAPQQFLGFPPRTAGFDPDLLRASPASFYSTLGLRFLRLVVVVPLVEEIFWRGFLLRYLIAEKFDRVPFGAFSWLSFTIVTVAFCFSHSRADWPAALVVGAFFNAVAWRTTSLSSCVLAHGLTNLSLGVWILTTRQWGFW